MTQQDYTYPLTASTPGQPLELTIPAEAEWVGVVRLATAGVAHRLGFTYEDIEDIKLAVTEACNNAILHAVSEDAQKLVQVQWLPSTTQLEIAVIDAGSLAPHQLPLHKPQVETSSSNLPEGGMGLLLIEALMDEVEQGVNAQGNTMLRMIKRLALDTRAHIGSAA